MHKDIAVKLTNISKVYKLYDKPVDRLKEALHPLKKKYHKNFYALKNIDLEIKKGEVLGIVGVNGAGKSTLLKIIAGVLTPTSGRITMNGRLNAILELGSGLKPEMTGLQNIKLNLQINGIYDDMEKLTQEIVEFADIGEHIHQPIKTYSSGMRARLGFGIATSTDPDILIVDEVLAVGDVLFQRKCYGKIEKLFKDGKTVIFVSHSAQSVIEFCSRAVLLYDREIILDDTPKKVTDFYQKLVFSKNKINVFEDTEVDNKSNKLLVHTKDEKYYLGNFQSTPTEISNYDVEIFDMIILNKNKNVVNILNINEIYTISYKVRFNIDCINVKFGHSIKTIKGLIISGETLPSRKSPISQVTKGTTYTIQSDFNTLLLPNNYLIDIGATSDINDKKEYLNMKYDILIVKVIGQDFNYWGHLNLWNKQRLNYEI